MQRADRDRVEKREGVPVLGHRSILAIFALEKAPWPVNPSLPCLLANHEAQLPRDTRSTDDSLLAFPLSPLV